MDTSFDLCGSIICSWLIVCWDCVQLESETHEKLLLEVALTRMDSPKEAGPQPTSSALVEKSIVVS